MSNPAQFRIGLALLAVGAAMAAAAGAQLGANDWAQTVVAGQGALGALQTPEPGSITPGERLAEWFAAHGLLFLVGMALVVGGAVLARHATRPQHSDTPMGDGAPGPRLVALVSAAHALQAQFAKAPDQAALEALELDHVEAFANDRSVLQREYGLAGYATVMGDFATGERLLNRSWSALVDGAVEESVASLDSAVAAFERAQATLDALEQG